MKIINIISFLFCGISIGWLMGLSVSPVIQTVIGSMLAVITSILTLLFSVQQGEIKEKITDKLGVINLFPLAVFLVGMSGAATLGIYARTNDWFGINPQSFKQKWELMHKDSTGIIKSLYTELHGEREKSDNLNQGVLFNNAENCDYFLKINDIEILSEQLQTLSPEWQLFVDSVRKNSLKHEQLQIYRKEILQNCK